MADFMLRQIPPALIKAAKAKAGGPGPLAALLRRWLARFVEGEEPAPEAVAALADSHRALRDTALRLRAESEAVHGLDCPKVFHDARRSGYLHAPDDDQPYDVDGVAYCGRCHEALPR